MSNKIDPKEVLIYLNELGYTNIDAYQLKLFIKDLKKLIKHKNNKENSLSNYDFNKSFNETEYEIFSAVTYSQPKIKVYHSNQSTPSSYTSSESKTSINDRPKTVIPVMTKKLSPEKDQICPGNKESCKGSPSHGAESKKPNSLASDCKCPIDPANKEVGSSCIKEKTKSGIKRLCSTTNSTDSRTASSKTCPSAKHNTKKFKHPCYCPGSLKPRSAVIKCNVGRKPTEFQKCDPVTLHQYYENQWKIQKIPGNNLASEQRFRWCLREKLCPGPSVQVKKGAKKKYDIVL